MIDRSTARDETTRCMGVPLAAPSWWFATSSDRPIEARNSTSPKSTTTAGFASSAAAAAKAAVRCSPSLGAVFMSISPATRTTSAPSTFSVSTRKGVL